MNTMTYMRTKLLFCVFAVMTTGLFISCSNEDTPNVTQSADFKIEFNEYGDLILKNYRPISQSDFNKYVLGYGWKEYDTRQVMSDGSVAPNDYWYGRVDGGPESYEFSEGKVIDYIRLDVIPSGASYREQTMHYDESTGKVYFDDRNIFVILSVSDDEITAIKKGEIINEDGDQEQIFLYVKMRKLSDNQLQDIKKVYWVDYNALFRAMIPQDI